MILFVNSHSRNKLTSRSLGLTGEVLGRSEGTKILIRVIGNMEGYREYGGVT